MIKKTKSLSQEQESSIGFINPLQSKQVPKNLKILSNIPSSSHSTQPGVFDEQRDETPYYPG